ncbi:MAG: hypothetical protein QOF63_720 [Thermoanaerobaculia bacterium]|nr:hypothetical protein [Thermoanaerobaculia bacterium]
MIEILPSTAQTRVSVPHWPAFSLDCVVLGKVHVAETLLSVLLMLG